MLGRLRVPVLALTCLAAALGEGTIPAEAQGPVPGDRYGVNISLSYADPQRTPKAVQLAHQAGIGWMHLTVFWAVVQPTPGPFD